MSLLQTFDALTGSKTSGSAGSGFLADFTKATQNKPTEAPFPSVPFSTAMAGSTPQASPGGDTTIFTMARDAAQAIPRSVISTGMTLAEAAAQATGRTSSTQFTPSKYGPLATSFFGKEPIVPLQEQAIDLQNKTGLGAIPAVLAVTTGDVLNLLPFGGSEQNLAKQLVRTKTAEEAAGLLQKAGVAEDLIPTYAARFAELTDQKTIQEGLNTLAELQSKSKAVAAEDAARSVTRAMPPEGSVPPRSSVELPALQEGQLPTEPDLSLSQPQTPKPFSSLDTITKDLAPLSRAAVDTFNVDHLAISPEAKDLVLKTVADVKPQLEETVGKTLSNDEALKLAQNSSKILTGTIGRDQTLQWEAAMASTRQALAAAAQTGVVDRNFLDTLMTVKTLGTDIGRKLQSLSIAAEPITKTPQLAILEAVTKVTDNVDAILEAAQGVDFNDFKQASEFYRRFIRPTTGEWIDLLRYNSMLSSPMTHFVNAFSNIVNGLVVGAVEKMALGSIDFLRSAITGGPRRALAGEAGAYLRGYFSRVSDATHRFADVMRGNRAFTNLDTKSIPLATKGIAGAIEKGLSVPLKFLEASDQFFTALTEAAEQASVDYLKTKGVDVPLPDKRVQDAAAYRLFRQDLFPDGQGTVLNALDEFTSKLMSLRSSKNPIVSTVSKFTVPFVKTPMNIFKQGIEYSPLGLTTLIKSKDAQTQIAKAAIGSVIFAGGATLLGSGRLTWGEPVNQDEKNAWRDAGRQPYSVKIGDTWVSYQKLPPAVAFPLSMIALIDDAVKNGKADESTTELILSSIAKFGEFLADQSYAKSIGDILAAAKGGANGMAQVASNYAQQLIPYRALGGWLARLTDEVQRQPDTHASFIDKEVQYLMMNIPGLSQRVPARLNALGEPINQQKQFINSFSPVRLSTETPDKAAQLDQITSIRKISQQATARAQEQSQQAEDEWNRLKGMNKEQAKNEFNQLASTDPKLAQKVTDIASQEALGLTYTDRLIGNLGIENGDRAHYLAEQFNALPTKEAKAQLWSDLVDKKLIDATVAQQISNLLKNTEPAKSAPSSFVDDLKLAFGGIPTAHASSGEASTPSSPDLISRVLGAAGDLLSSHMTATNTPRPGQTVVRGVPIAPSDIQLLRGILFAEISNRSSPKQELEARTIINTALNRVAQHGGTLASQLTAPKQYQGYGSKEYQRFLAGKTGKADTQKLDSINGVLADLQAGTFDDNIDGYTFYTHAPDGKIIATKNYSYAK